MKEDCTKHHCDHHHGPDCGHPAVEHDGHLDYLVEGHLHHPVADGCECHGDRGAET